MPIYKMGGKKDGKQKYRVRVNYQDSYGNNKQIDRVAYGADAAKQLELELTHSVKVQNIKENKKITLHRLVDEYLQAKQGEVRETTINKCNTLMKNHVFSFFDGINKNITIDKLDVPLMQKWKIHTKKKNLSLKMNQNIYGTFRTVLNYAVQMEYIQKNPLLKVGNFKDSTIEKHEMDYYTQEEFSKFIQVAAQSAEKCATKGDYKEWSYYTFFMIAFLTGARKGEINALQWDDINGDYLSIKRSVAQKLKGGDRITPPKNKSSIRTLQMPEQLIAALNEQKRRQQDIIKDFNENLFVCGGYEPLRDTSIDNKNKQYAEIAGIKKIRIHDFRHSHVSLLANAGINIQEVARRLGHARVEMTWNTYSHLYPKEEERAVEVLNNIEF